MAWKGVADKRESEEVGVQTQKGKEEIPIYSEPPLKEIVDNTLKKLFTSCGMKLNVKGDDATTLSAEIREFYVGVEKKLLTGKSRAVSSIAFLTRHGQQSSTVVVGFEMESKKIRSGKLKQLEKTLNELFIETIKQIPETKEMRELK